MVHRRPAVTSASATGSLLAVVSVNESAGFPRVLNSLEKRRRIFIGPLRESRNWASGLKKSPEFWSQ